MASLDMASTDRRERSDEPLVVLLVEDNADHAHLLRRALAQGGVRDIALLHVRRVASAIDRLGAGGIDAILLDLMLPDSSGLETVRRVHAAAAGVPVVVLTSSADLGIEAIHEGAQDYLTKGRIDGPLVRRALAYAVERQRREAQGRQLAREQAARASAEEALRARDEFLSVAAHELYTPIAALSLSTQSLLADFRASPPRDPPALARKLGIIERQAARLTRLARSLLEVSGMRAGRFELSLEPTDLVRLVTDVAAALEPERVGSGSTLTLRGEGTLMGLWDRNRVGQVVTNLLSNAIKYGAGRPIEVTIRSEGERALLSVADQGIGIAPETRQRIFGRFERAVPSREYGGLGLGLYIVHRIVEAHGGFVEVTGEPGHGSTFLVGLPRGLREPRHAPGPVPSR
jgi:signal transduction histidine kinase